MCLAVPGRVIHISGKTASVDFGGIRRQVLIDLLPDVKIGEYVLVHAGFAIQRLETESAEDLLAGFAEVPDEAADLLAGFAEVPEVPGDGPAEDSPDRLEELPDAPEKGPWKDTGDNERDI